MIQQLESRQLLSGVYPYPDVPPLAPTDLSAAVVTVGKLKYVRVKWTDVSQFGRGIPGTVAQVWVAKGRNPVGNVWALAGTTPTLHYIAGGRRWADVPYKAGCSWNVRNVITSPPAPVSYWHTKSDQATLKGVFVP